MNSKTATTLAGREVLLCISGGVACFKAAALVSMFVRAGAGVNVAMTEAAQQFVTPLTFQSLIGRQVHTSMWNSPERYDIQHIALTDQAEIIVVAPATANILAKISNGIADDLVSSLLCASLGAKDILVAPAMNTRMWSNPAVQNNIRTLADYDVHMIGPAEGRLACGTTGAGRMSEPEDIFDESVKILTTASL